MHSLETSENLQFSGIFGKCIKGTLLRKGYHNTNEKQLSSSVAKVTPDVKYKLSLLVYSVTLKQLKTSISVF